MGFLFFTFCSFVLTYDFCIHPAANTSACQGFIGEASISFNDVSTISNTYFYEDITIYIDGTNGLIAADDQKPDTDKDGSAFSRIAKKGQGGRTITFKPYNNQREKIVFSDINENRGTNVKIIVNSIDFVFHSDPDLYGGKAYSHFYDVYLANCTFSGNHIWYLEFIHATIDLVSSRGFFQVDHFLGSLVLLDNHDPTLFVNPNISRCTLRAGNLDISNACFYDSINFFEGASGSAVVLQFIKGSLVFNTTFESSVSLLTFMFKSGTTNISFIEGTQFDGGLINMNFKNLEESQTQFNGKWKAFDNISVWSNSYIECNKDWKITWNMAIIPFCIKHNSKNLTFITTEGNTNFKQSYITQTPKGSFLIIDTKFAPPSNLYFDGDYILSQKINPAIVFSDYAQTRVKLTLKRINMEQSWGSSYYEDVFPIEFYIHMNGNVPYFPNIIFEDGVYPDVSTSFSIVVNPNVSPSVYIDALLRSLTDSVFLTINNASSFLKNAKIIFPTTPGQVGFWNQSSIATGSIVTSPKIQLKISVNPSLRSNLPLYLCLASPSQMYYCNAKSYVVSDIDQFNTVLSNLNEYLPNVTKTMYLQMEFGSSYSISILNFSSISSDRLSGLSVEIYSSFTDKSKQPRFYFMNNHFLSTPLKLVGLRFDLPDQVSSWVFSGILDIHNCSLSNIASEKVTFASGSNITFNFLYQHFADYGNARKNIGGADSRNAKFYVNDFSSLSKLEFGISGFNSQPIVIAYYSQGTIPIALTSINNLTRLNTGRNYTEDSPLLITSTISNPVVVGSFEIEAWGNIKINNNYSSIVFNRSLVFVHYANPLKFIVDIPSMPSITSDSSSTGAVEWGISSSYISQSTKSESSISFPSSFEGRVIKANSGLFRNGSGIIITPKSNIVEIEEIIIPENAIVQFNSVTITKNLVLSTSSRLSLSPTEANQLAITAPSIDIYWNTEDGFPYLELKGQPLNKYPQINLIYDSTYQYIPPNPQSFNTLFGSIINNSSNNEKGTLLIKSLGAACANLLSAPLSYLNTTASKIGFLQSHNIVFSFFCQDNPNSGLQDLYLISNNINVPQSTPYPKETPYPTSPGSNTYVAIGGLLGALFIVSIIIALSISRATKRDK